MGASGSAHKGVQFNLLTKAHLETVGSILNADTEDRLALDLEPLRAADALGVCFLLEARHLGGDLWIECLLASSRPADRAQNGHSRFEGSSETGPRTPATRRSRHAKLRVVRYRRPRGGLRISLHAYMTTAMKISRTIVLKSIVTVLLLLARVTGTDDCAPVNEAADCTAIGNAASMTSANELGEGSGAGGSGSSGGARRGGAKRSAPRPPRASRETGAGLLTL
jgi:hypothetical protein